MCADDVLDIKEIVNNTGNRLTKQRTLILQYLRSVSNHPTAEDIFEAVKKDLPKINISTVYRNLKYSVDNGFIIQVVANDGKSRYDANTQYHGHFICTECVKIYDIWQASRRIAKDLKSMGKIKQVEYYVYWYLQHMCCKYQ